MTFRFTSNACPQAPTLDLCLEASFDDGKVIQAIYMRTTAGTRLAYRESRTGPWRNSEGISFGENPRTPENLIKSIGSRDPVRLVYVLPAA